ncbi:MAG: heavy-metal-associated domain-containing protein [Kocuria sp.]|uniref:Heavy-metal-associated domain-containing protein n=1 Tax=Kocuria salsicia TaxID=664639 RepID=A0ABV3KE93_9MICC|nr:MULTISPECIES: heavy-metal-associated domain-containing protein [Kocuria]MDO4257112.1 heavy-metal-associated domain-containing protein [Kocuria sp.]
MTTTVNVSGMTCGHCVSSVKEELAEVPGVTAVDVDLNSGGISPVTIESTGDLDLQAVTEAVAEAGYSVV